MKVYFSVFKTALQAKFEYRVDFFLGVATSTLLQLSALSFLWVIVHHTPDLAGWKGREIVMLFGLTAAALGLSELFFNHIWMLPSYVVQGDLDRLLVYPAHSLYFLLLSRPELHAFGNLATGSALVFLSAPWGEAPWGFFFLLPIWIFCGCLIYTSALVCFGALSFRFLSPFSHFFFLPQHLLQASRYPLAVYPDILRWMLLVFLPYGTFTTLPADWLFHDKPYWFGLAPVPAALFAVLSAHWFWEKGVRYYESTGS